MEVKSNEGWGSFISKFQFFDMGEFMQTKFINLEQAYDYSFAVQRTGEIYTLNLLVENVLFLFVLLQNEKCSPFEKTKYFIKVHQFS